MTLRSLGINALRYLPFLLHVRYLAHGQDDEYDEDVFWRMADWAMSITYEPVEVRFIYRFPAAAWLYAETHHGASTVCM